jgi:hypothetical protein
LGILARRLIGELLEDLNHAVDQLHRALALLLVLLCRSREFGGFALLKFLIGRRGRFGCTAACRAEQRIAFKGTDRDFPGLPVEALDPVLGGLQELVGRLFVLRLSLCLCLGRRTGSRHNRQR